MYASVLIKYPVKNLDKTFTYEIPDDYKSIIKVGMKVTVPFNNTFITGIILKITNEKPDLEIKKIVKIENKDLYLNKELLNLGLYLKEQTLCPLISAYETMLPTSLKIKNEDKKLDKFVTYIFIDDKNKAREYKKENQNREGQIKIIDALLKNDKLLKKEYNTSSLNTLIKKGIIQELKEKVNRIDNAKLKKINNIVLNEEQKAAYETVKKSLNEYKTFLIEGVTGSGKTEVYLNLIEDVIKLNKSAICLVPEICLTTQTVKRFYERFGKNVAVFHSGLSSGEKYDEYLKIYNDEVKIVVGTRSSIFVPLKNLGLIIIDEEHSETYKQDSTPRYSALDMAQFRAKYNNIPLILASATPRLETKARCQKGLYTLIKLTKRANQKPLPQMTIIDMKKEIENKNFIFSNALKEKIAERLLNHEQIILLLNRRGYSTFISCSACGYTYKCPNCDISLTYHKSSNNLRCHYCGYVTKKDDECPDCHQKSLNYLGLGTERVENEIHSLFPEARVIRMDQDTTTKKGSYQKIIDDFADFKYDILLGTQMISKGLDFKDVTLVGIINADTSLNIPDFRSNEKTFSLLYQTSGRAGRSEKSGEVILQTYNPDNPVFNFLKNNDFTNFYYYEMNIRHKLKYPPYTYIVSITISSKDYDKASKEANIIKKYLEKDIDKSSIIYGPTPAGIFRINNVYHFGITIKYTFDEKLKIALKNIDDMYVLNKNVFVDITFNPSRF